MKIQAAYIGLVAHESAKNWKSWSNEWIQLSATRQQNCFFNVFVRKSGQMAPVYVFRDQSERDHYRISPTKQVHIIIPESREKLLNQAGRNASYSNHKQEQWSRNSLLAASKSQSRREPDWEPATTRSSELLNWMHSTGLVWPVKLYSTDIQKLDQVCETLTSLRQNTARWESSTMMQLGLLTAQILTLQSSPPEASRRPDDFPNTSEDTLLEWATISSKQQRTILNSGSSPFLV